MAALYLLLGFAAQTRPDGKCGGGASEGVEEDREEIWQRPGYLTDADASSPAGCGMASRRIRSAGCGMGL